MKTLREDISNSACVKEVGKRTKVRAVNNKKKKHLNKGIKEAMNYNYSNEVILA